MIAYRILWKSVIFIQVAIAYILPRQTKPAFYNVNMTGPSYPTITPGSAPFPRSTAAIHYSVYGTKITGHVPNGTTAGVSIANGSTNAFANASLCFFVVQDTMSIRFWTEYITTERWFKFTVTSLITEATQYIDTIVTNYATSITPTWTLSTVTETQAEDQFVSEHQGPRPLRDIEALNETLITSWGRTFTSPEPFYIYSTVKILAVPAITLTNGQSACATAVTSTYFLSDRTTSWPLFTETMPTLPSGNSKVYEYFDGDLSSVTSTSLPAHALKPNPALLDGIDAVETTLVLATPYIYFPNLSDANGFEDYGYIPQALINLITQSPDITSNFPFHASFLPGGPSIPIQIIYVNTQNDIVVQVPAEDLTISTAFTVTSAGCFHPDACQLHDIQGTATSMPPTAHNLIQSPAFGAGVPTQAVKMTSPSGLKDTQRENFALPPSKTALKDSATKYFPPAITSKVVGDSGPAKKYPADSPPASPVITLDSLIITANSAFEFELGSQTLAPGGDPVLFSSTTYSLAPSATAIVVNGVSSALIPVKFQGPGPVITDDSDGLSHFADGSNIEIVNNASPYIVGSTTVMPGFAPIVVSGTTYSLDSSASTIFVNNIASPLPKLEESRPRFAPVLSIGSRRVTANAASEYIVGGQTLSPGGSPIVVSGTTYSLAGQASALVVNGVTSALPVSQQTNLPSRRVLSIGSLRLTADARSEYILESQTLSPGGSPIVVSGTTYSLAGQASVLVINGVTSILPAYQPTNLPSRRILSIGSLRLTADARSELILEGQTLSRGGRPIVVSGTTYSLGSQASVLVINGVTSTLPAYQETNLPSRQVLSIGSLRLTADARSEYILGSRTLSPGGRPIVVSGTTYSLGSQASVLVINGVTSSLPAEQGAKPTPEPIIKVGSQYLTAEPALRYVLNGETLIPNARPIVVAGTTYSLAPEASALMVNGVKIILPGPETPPISSKSNPTSYQLDYIVGSQTLIPGAPAITISGTAISLVASRNTIVIDGSALPFPTDAAPSFTIDSQLITAIPVSRPIAADETLKAAAVTTSSGNTEAASSTPDLNTGSPASTTPSDAGGSEHPGPTSKSEGSRGGLGLVEQVLGISLVVVGWALL